MRTILWWLFGGSDDAATIQVLSIKNQELSDCLRNSQSDAAELRERLGNARVSVEELQGQLKHANESREFSVDLATRNRDRNKELTAENETLKAEAKRLRSANQVLAEQLELYRKQIIPSKQERQLLAKMMNAIESYERKFKQANKKPVAKKPRRKRSDSVAG